MNIDWILYLAGNLIISAGIALLGKNILDIPENDRSVFLAFRTKQSQQSDEAWNYGQKTFGTLCFKGGMALCLLDVIVMLVVVMLSNTVISIAGLLLLVIELCFLYFAGWRTDQQIKERFEKAETGAEPEPEAKDKPKAEEKPLVTIVAPVSKEEPAKSPAEEQPEPEEAALPEAESAASNEEPAASEPEEKAHFRHAKKQ